MQNKIFNAPPAVLATLSSLAGGNLLNIFTSQTPAWTGVPTAQPYALAKHIHALNLLSTVAAFVTLFKGLTGTQLTTQSWEWSSVSIPASGYIDWYGQQRFDSADFLTGISNLPSAISITIDGEVGIA
jgi:hypothetical protein